MAIVLLAGKEQDGGAFPSLRLKEGFQEPESLLGHGESLQSPDAE